MKYNYNSTDDWKSSLMNLPDNSFFELFRTVFGNIKTPFNKQRLLNDLYSLLSRDEIRNTISSYIDKTDHKLIAAIALLENPCVEDLVSFFSGEFSKTELGNLLINLEERLILYRFPMDGKMHLSLNPVLAPVLDPYTENTSLLLPGLYDDLTEDEPPASNIVPMEKYNASFFSDSRQMASLVSFILSEDLFKFTGKGMEIKKRGLDEGKKIFPALDLESCFSIMLRLGLLFIQAEKIIVHRKKMADFCRLNPKEMLLYWTSALYLCLEEGSSGFSGERNRLKRIASFMLRYRERLDSTPNLPKATLIRLIELLEKEEEKPVWGSHLFNDKAKINHDSFLQAMERTGLLNEPLFFENYRSEDSGDSEAAVMVMDASFSFVLYPEISHENAMSLASFCNVRDTTVFPRNGSGNDKQDFTSVSFILNRESAVRGFDLGITSSQMLELLEKLTSNRLEKSLGWTLKEWEGRYAEVFLGRGVIMVLSEDRRYLAEAEPVASLIRRIIIPGVYLLSSDDNSEALMALKKAGVDIIAQPLYQEQEIGEFSEKGNYFPSINVPILSSSKKIIGEPSKEESPKEELIKKETPQDPVYAENDSIKEKFRNILEKMSLTKPERDELTARIERRLVFDEKQLDKNSVRYEKLEARGLDFAGKTSIAKYAVENASIVEVFWSSPDGESLKCTGIAEALDKKGNDSILHIRTESDDDSQLFMVPLKKISLLRRIKQSIFGE